MLRLINIGLRLATLVTKFGLTFYLARYLNLADMGTYGLIVGAVMVMNVALGIRLDYSVARDIVGVSQLRALCMMRDQAVFYTLNYLVLALVIILLLLCSAVGDSPKILLYLLILAIIDGFATISYSNLVSLERPLLANVMLFIRAGIWVIPVILLGIAMPAWRTLDHIMVAWVGGTLLSLMVTLWFWRTLPWRSALHTPIDWLWIKGGVKKCVPIWLGSIGLFGGFYIDRFIVGHYLGLDYAGVATFYLSFATSLITLIQSGVLSFAYPRLIRQFRDQDFTAFRRDMSTTYRHVALFAGAMVMILSIGVPWLAQFFAQPKLLQELPTFWLIMAGIWIRANAETLNYILYARHQDRAIWIGNLLFLLPGLLGNLILIPFIGFLGVGISMVLASLSLFAWRLWHVRRFAAAI
jgi:O-antigen/teichoic acid export membrane protein